MIQAKPFLKWAGGKRQLLKEIENNLPEEIIKRKEIDTYIEPFVGGGAVFFFLLSNYTIKKALINDINSDLMLSYEVIKLYPEDLIKRLRDMEREFLSLDTEGRSEYFYEKLRKPFNELVVDRADKETLIEKVALLVALNKTCFNGLYRQNSKGEFNVPFGRYKNPRILDEENIKNCHILLQNTEIHVGSYDSIEIPSNGNTFIYFDPPYRPLNGTSSFTKYSKDDFNDEDQKKLAKYCKELSERGYKLLLSNSDPKNVNIEDNFFDDLYKEFDIVRVSANRSINSVSSKRGKITELLVRNF